MTQSWWTLADRDDRDYASDRHSRYGAYLAARIDQALADDEVRDAVGWTAWCWWVASHPVMAPGYVVEADPIERTTLWRDPHSGGLAATVVAAAPLLLGIGRRWRTWHVDVRHRLTYGTEPRALTRIEFESVLPEPPDRWALPPSPLPCERRELVTAAKDAVGRAARVLDAEYAEPLTVLARGLHLDRGRGADLSRA